VSCSQIKIQLTSPGKHSLQQTFDAWSVVTI